MVTVANRRHGLIGAVHVVRPKRDEIRWSLAQEADICRASRIVLDLTDAAPLDDEEIRVIIDLCEGTDPERMQIVVPLDTPDDFCDSLSRVSHSVTRTGE